MAADLIHGFNHASTVRNCGVTHQSAGVRADAITILEPTFRLNWLVAKGAYEHRLMQLIVWSHIRLQHTPLFFKTLSLLRARLCRYPVVL